MRLARKFDRRRFGLSADALGLLRAKDGRWEYVDLADGPAAQGLILRDPSAPPPLIAIMCDEDQVEESPQEDQDDLFPQEKAASR